MIKNCAQPIVLDTTTLINNLCRSVLLSPPHIQLVLLRQIPYLNYQVLCKKTVKKSESDKNEWFCGKQAHQHVNETIHFTHYKTQPITIFTKGLHFTSFIRG